MISADATPPRRRFEAQAILRREHWIRMYAGLALFTVAMGVVANALPRAASRVLTPLLIIAGLIAYFVWLFLSFRQPPVVLEVGDERLVVDEGRGGSFPLAGARLGLWRMPGFGVTAGTALHLVGDGQTFVVAGRDHRPAPGLHLAAGPVEQVAATLAASDFDALLAALPSWVLGARADAPPSPEPLRITLASNPSSGRHILRTMLPWLGTIVLLAAVSVGTEVTGVAESPAGRAALTPILIAMVVGGLVLTFVRGMRRPPGLVLEVASKEIRLRDAGKDVVLVAALVSGVTVTRGTHKISGRGGSYELPTLKLRFSPSHEIAVGVFDMRFGWSEPAPSVRAPRWIVGPPDWYALLDLFGLRELVVVDDDGFLLRSMSQQRGRSRD